MEQAAGIEPVLSAWEAEVLPLNYACKEVSTIVILLLGCGTNKYYKLFSIDCP